MANLIANQRLILRKLLYPSLRQTCQRLVSTSNKNNDTATTIDASKAAETHAKSEKNWVSYGFDYKNKEADRSVTHATFFVSISLCLVFVGFYWAYIPDVGLHEWAQREAFLELRRREKNGLPLIDPNFISPDKISLPSDEELGDTEIVI